MGSESKPAVQGGTSLAVGRSYFDPIPIDSSECQIADFIVSKCYFIKCHRLRIRVCKHVRC